MEEYPDRESATNEYAERFAGSVGRVLLKRQSELLLKVLALVREDLGTERSESPQLRLLDVGGGHGQVVAALTADLSMGLTVLASSVEALGQVAEAVADQRVAASIGALHASGLAAESFEVVTCLRQLPHFSEWRALIAELCRLSNSLVVVDYPPSLSSNLLYSIFFPLKKRLEGNTRHFRLFSHREVVDEFAKHGFTPIFREGQFLLPLVLYRALKSPALISLLEFPGARLGLRKYFGNPVIAGFRKRRSG